MIDSMQQELVTLTPLNGKKAFLFLTGGFEYQPGYVMAQYASGSLPHDGEHQRPRHLAASDHDGPARQRRPDHLLHGRRHGTDRRGHAGLGGLSRRPTSIALEHRPSLSLPGAAGPPERPAASWPSRPGGIALLNTNDFDRGLVARLPGTSRPTTRSASTLSKLGIDQGYQDVKVDGEPPGRDRARPQGLRAPPGEPDVVSNRALATMETDLSYNAIPATIQTAPATPDKKYYLLPVTVLVPRLGPDVRARRRQGDRPRRVLHRRGRRQGRPERPEPPGDDLPGPGGQGRRARRDAALRGASSRRRRATTGSSSTCATSRAARWGRRGRTCGSSNPRVGRMRAAATQGPPRAAAKPPSTPARHRSPTDFFGFGAGAGAWRPSSAACCRPA